MNTVISHPGRASFALLIAAALCGSAPVRAWAQTPAAELEAGADRETGIAGRVMDRRNNRGLAEAPVVVQGGGRTRTLFTDQQGVYRVNLPPGQYIVRSYFDFYHGSRIDGVPVE